MKHITRTATALLLGLAFNTSADTSGLEKNLARLNLPEGFNISIFAEVPNARQMALGQSTGTVFVGTRGSKVHAVVDRDKDRKADQVVTILDDLKVGNGVAMYQGYLYVAEQHRIARYPAPGFDLSLPFSQMREVIYEDLPDKGHHGWRYIKFGPDGKLYVTVGIPCNICAADGIEATIIRMDPDGGNAEIFAHGIRNSVGMAFQPDSGHLYFTDNNTDMMGDDDPAGELNAAPEAGMHFGFPYYAGGRSRHPDWQDRTPPQEVTFPVVEFQAHTANLGLSFYTGEQFPQDYVGDAIIAQHGSWNRSEPVGYRLMRVRFDQHGKVTDSEVFIDGWLENGEAWGRPVDVMQLPDGSLLVSDDYNEVIYRISYGESTASQPVAAGSGKTRLLADDLNWPESVVSHPDGRIFVSEIGEFGRSGDGVIREIAADGDSRILTTNLDDPKGLDLFDNALYVTDIKRVLRIKLDGSQEVIASDSQFPGKVVFLNDIEIEGNGTIYVSDSGEEDGKHAGVYRITPDGKITEIVSDKDPISRPNGLLMDGMNRLLIADIGSGELQRLELADARLRVLNSGFGGADGLVRDTHGFLYISDWKNGKVWQLAGPRATPQLIREGLKAAADIGLSADGRYLLVPDMKAGTLEAVPLH